MKGIILCLLVFTCAAQAHSVPADVPSLQFIAPKDIVQWVIDQALGYLDGILSGEELPPISGSAPVIIGTVNYEISGVRMEHLDKGDFRIETEGSGIQVYANRFHGRLVGNWAYSFQVGFIKLGESGSFAADLDFDIDLNVRVESPNGKPKVVVDACSIEFHELGVKFEGGQSWLINMFTDFVAGAFKGFFGDMMCGALNTVIGIINPLIDIIPLYYQATDSSHNFYMADTPIISADSLQLGNGFPEYVTISCKASVCLMFLPKAVIEQYPDSRAVFRLKVNELPKLSLTPGGLSASLDAYVESYIRDEASGEDVFLFSANVNADAALGFSFADGRFKFEVTTLEGTVTLIENEVEGFSEHGMNALIRAVLDHVIKPKLNEIGENGLPFPKIGY